MNKQLIVGNVIRSVTAFAVAVGSVGFIGGSQAYATGTYTWSGTAGDNLFSTAGNWAGGVVPTDGADLVFPCVVGAPAGQTALTNDLTGIKIASLATPSGPEGCGGSFKIDVIDFTPTATVNGASYYGSAYVNVDTITGVSDLSHNASYTLLHNKEGNAPYALSSLTVTEDVCGADAFKDLKPSNLIMGNGTAMWPLEGSTVSVLQNARLGIGYSNTDATVANNVTFAQGSEIGASHACMGGPGAATNVTVTMTGNIVLNGDVKYDLGSNVTLKITGNLSGSGKLIAGVNNKGVLNVAAASNTSGTPNSIVDNNTPTTVKLEGDDANKFETITRNVTATLEGKRGMVTVNEGGILKGTGTANSLYVAGVVAPGNSPGTITVLNDFSLQAGGVYSAEILNSTEYDKIVAGSVTLDPASALELKLAPGAQIKKGDTYTIVDNTGAGAINGTFSGLAEGAQLVVDGATFSISYVGGDGNDVVLTALNDISIPGVPNTGVAQVLSSPLGVAGSTIATLGVLVYLFKRK